MGLFGDFFKAFLSSDSSSQQRQGRTYEPPKRYTPEELVVLEQERSGERWHGVPLSELSKLAQTVYHGKYVKVELSEDNKNMLFIPAGFAHGFVVLSDEAELLYKASGEYNPTADRGILWSDKDLNIDWGINFKPILSEKDKVQDRKSVV